MIRYASAEGSPAVDLEKFPDGYVGLSSILLGTPGDSPVVQS